MLTPVALVVCTSITIAILNLADRIYRGHCKIQVAIYKTVYETP